MQIIQLSKIISAEKILVANFMKINLTCMTIKASFHSGNISMGSARIGT